MSAGERGDNGAPAGRLWPDVPDLVFGLVLTLIGLGGPHRLLNDPGTLWHLRLGREIFESGTVPRADTFTYTRLGTPWVDQSWLFDALLARLVGSFGWSAAVLTSALGMAFLYASLARWLLKAGRGPLSALVVAVLAAAVGSIHFLVRPHLVTLAFFLVTLRLCARQHERGGRAVFGVVPLVALWANLHGGFLAAPVVVAAAGLGHALSGPLDRARRANLGKFAAALVLVALAPLLNPYGFGLYRHVIGLLFTSGVTPFIDEHQPVPFGKPESRVIELVVFALIALPTLSLGRMSRYELTQTLTWLHLGLVSVRQCPLFALAVAPGLARALDSSLAASADRAQTASPRWSVWPGLVSVGLAVGVGSGAFGFGGEGTGVWPRAALPALNRFPISLRLFHEQDWGGLIEAETVPTRPAFIDDRFELFGRDRLLQYVNALEGGADWDLVREADGIGLVWVRPGRGLVRRLERDPAWRVAYRDERSILMVLQAESRPSLAAGETPRPKSEVGPSARP